MMKGSSPWQQFVSCSPPADLPCHDLVPLKPHDDDHDDKNYGDHDDNHDGGGHGGDDNNNDNNDLVPLKPDDDDHDYNHYGDKHHDDNNDDHNDDNHDGEGQSGDDNNNNNHDDGHQHDPGPGPWTSWLHTGGLNRPQKNLHNVKYSQIMTFTAHLYNKKNTFYCWWELTLAQTSKQIVLYHLLRMVKI